jgi:hypothetical protein
MATYDDLLSKAVGNAQGVLSGQNYNDAPWMRGIRSDITDQGNKAYNVALNNAMRSGNYGGSFGKTVAGLDEDKLKQLIGSFNTNANDVVKTGLGAASTLQTGALGEEKIAADRQAAWLDAIAKAKTARVQSEASNTAAEGQNGNCFSGCRIMTKDWTVPLELPVRKFRDERFGHAHPEVAIGYKRMAGWLVPTMMKNRVVGWLVHKAIITPLSKCAYYHYKNDFRGRLWEPIGLFWLILWGLIGRIK